MTDLQGLPGTLVRLAKVEPGTLTLDRGQHPQRRQRHLDASAAQPENPALGPGRRPVTTLLANGAVAVKEGDRLRAALA